MYCNTVNFKLYIQDNTDTACYISYRCSECALLHFRVYNNVSKNEAKICSLPTPPNPPKRTQTNNPCDTTIGISQ